VRDEKDEQRLWSRTAFAEWSAEEHSVDLDPDSEWWRSAPSVSLASDAHGVPVAWHDTEVRLRWSETSLYLLFLCDYRELSLRDGLVELQSPTPDLWEHDVAELFLGRDADPFDRYMEFEVSPRGEWIDLQIRSRDGEVLERAPRNSHFQSGASIDAANLRWCAFMRVPLPVPDHEGFTNLRLNLLRSQGPRPTELTWQPTHHISFHVPAVFGYLRLLRS
jgi:hypothetical protein